jgi:hypothetical protein
MIQPARIQRLDDRDIDTKGKYVLEREFDKEAYVTFVDSLGAGPKQQ